MSFKKVVITTLSLFLILAVFAPAFAAKKDRMTYEEYLAELDRWKVRQNAADTQIDMINGQIGDLESEINAIQKRIDDTWAEIYAMLGVNPSEFGQYTTELDALQNEIAAWNRETPRGIYDRRDELADLEARMNDVGNRPHGKLSQFNGRINQMRAQLAQIRARMAKPRTKTHVVMRGDYLWKIAGMPEYLGDPWKWMRIYSMNADQIDDPDLIFPDQSLTVPLDIDTQKYYLVAKGDFLHSIASTLYGDPFQWRKLYEANKSFIDDPSVIYPESVLTIPGR